MSEEMYYTEITMISGNVTDNNQLNITGGSEVCVRGNAISICEKKCFFVSLGHKWLLKRICLAAECLTLVFPSMIRMIQI